ncbi:MAG: Flp family type IVb pilin [Desulforudis sp.]|nr:MAG: Flp family type IVb pilin [Desulforudis sp.]
MPCLKKLLIDESGQGLVEYGLIILLMALALFTTLKLFGDKVRSFFENTAEEISSL